MSAPKIKPTKTVTPEERAEIVRLAQDFQRVVGRAALKQTGYVTAGERAAAKRLLTMAIGEKPTDEEIDRVLDAV